MNIFRFLNWEVYQDSKKIITIIFKIVNKLPKEYRYDLGSQVIRSAVSISLNIAEGSGKHSDKELNRFFNISLGSVSETLAIIDILHDINLITNDEFFNIVKKLESIANQLSGFKKKLKSQV